MALAAGFEGTPADLTEHQFLFMAETLALTSGDQHRSPQRSELHLFPIQYVHLSHIIVLTLEELLLCFHQAEEFVNVISLHICQSRWYDMWSTELRLRFRKASKVASS